MNFNAKKLFFSLNGPGQYTCRAIFTLDNIKHTPSTNMYVQFSNRHDGSRSALAALFSRSHTDQPASRIILTHVTTSYQKVCGDIFCGSKFACACVLLQTPQIFSVL